MRYAIIIILLFVLSCKAQDLPKAIAYEIDATVYRIGERKTLFSARNGRMLLEAPNNKYDKEVEYRLFFEITGNEGNVLQIIVHHKQESREQWFKDYESGKATLKQRGFRIEKLIDYKF